MKHRGQNCTAVKPTDYNMRFYMYAAVVLPSTYTNLDMEVTAIAGNNTEAHGVVPTQWKTQRHLADYCVKHMLGYGTAWDERGLHV